MGTEARKASFVARHGVWSEGLEGLAEVAPEFFDAYAELAGVPWVEGRLPTRVKALILIAVCASPSHLNASALRTQLRHALTLGATREEIVEVLQLAASLGLHSCAVGIPALAKEMERAAGKRGADTSGAAEEPLPPLDPERQALKDEFVRVRGYWATVWEQMLRLSPAFFRAYLRFSGVPWRSGTLDAKTKELIYIALDSALTHLYEPGLRVHIRNAMAQGATPEEILEVFQLVAGIGVHACELGIPILFEELTAVESKPASS